MSMKSSKSTSTHDAPESCFVQILVGGLVFSYLSGFRCRQQSQQFRSDLTEKQKKTYDVIVKNRKETLLRGFLWSTVLVLLYSMIRTFQRHPVCLWKAIFWWLLIPQIYYLGVPQPTYLLDHQRQLSSEQVQEWLQVYQCYKQSMIHAFVVGCIVTSIILWMYYK